MTEVRGRGPSPVGRVLSVRVPASAPAGLRPLSPRPARLYLPPAHPDPALRPGSGEGSAPSGGADGSGLPVLVLMSGQPGSPEDWVTRGGLVETMDALAALYDGIAPIVLVVDQLGSPWRNPLGSDTARGGAAATYLEEDVPSWLREHTAATADPARWAIGGVSNGATCALQVIARRRAPFRTFLAMSAQEHPCLEPPALTVPVGFGGDPAAFEANDPLSLWAAARPGAYDGVAGVLSAGRSDRRYAPAVPVLARAAGAAGIEVSTRSYTGGHEWSVWSRALADQAGWLAGRLGLGA